LSQLAVRLHSGAGDPKFTYCDLREQRKQPPDVIGMSVADGNEIEVIDISRTKIGEKDGFPCVGDLSGKTTAVHKPVLAIRKVNEEGVTLPDVQSCNRQELSIRRFFESESRCDDLLRFPGKESKGERASSEQGWAILAQRPDDERSPN
jgi:hypothetical protein